MDVFKTVQSKMVIWYRSINGNRKFRDSHENQLELGQGIQI
jgi:hypothetical protein